MPPERRRPNEPGEHIPFYKIRYRYRQLGFEYTRTRWLRGQEALTEALEYTKENFYVIGPIVIETISEYEYIQATRPTD